MKALTAARVVGLASTMAAACRAYHRHYEVNTLNGVASGRAISVGFTTIAVPRSGATTCYVLTARI